MDDCTRTGGFCDGFVVIYGDGIGEASAKGSMTEGRCCWKMKKRVIADLPVDDVYGLAYLGIAGNPNRDKCG